MAVFTPVTEIRTALPAPRLLVELPSRPRVFFGNLRDLLFPRRLSPLELRSAPAEFWADVFVKRPLPWRRFLESAAYHLIAVDLVIALSHIFLVQPRLVSKPTFERSQIIYYRASEYLPPLDTRTGPEAAPRKADPEFSRQTVVTPPQVRLNTNVAMPNIVAWSDRTVNPRLAIQPAPVSPAAEITRLAPTFEQPVVAPPQDPARVSSQRALPGLHDPVAAPPTDVRSNAPTEVRVLQPALAAPPTDVGRTDTRRLGDFNIASSAAVAPAPQLAVAPQRTASGGGAPSLGAPQIAAPPQALPGSGSSGS